jgi:hypothetical protein
VAIHGFAMSQMLLAMTLLAAWIATPLKRLAMTISALLVQGPCVESRRIREARNDESNRHALSKTE